MKANVLTNRERELVKRTATAVAMKLAEKQMDDIAIRAQYVVFVSMLECGLSPKTVNRVLGMLPTVKEKYAHYNIDDLADYVFYQHLTERGVNVKKTSTEENDAFISSSSAATKKIREDATQGKENK